MKIFFADFISESKQVGDVYHFTSLHSLITILNTDFLKGYWSSSILNDFDVYTMRYRTISTTRDKNYVNSRGFISISGDDIALVLDGTKLSTKYKCRPIDDRYDVASNKVKNASFGDEQEEVWYGNLINKDQGIKNIKSYIKKIIFTKKFINYIDTTSTDRLNKHYTQMSVIPGYEFLSNLQFKNSMTLQEKLEKIAEIIQEKFDVKVEVPKVNKLKLEPAWDGVS